MTDKKIFQEVRYDDEKKIIELKAKGWLHYASGYETFIVYKTTKGTS